MITFDEYFRGKNKAGPFSVNDLQEAFQIGFNQSRDFVAISIERASRDAETAAYERAASICENAGYKSAAILVRTILKKDGEKCPHCVNGMVDLRTVCHYCGGTGNAMPVMKQ
jgi:hypothetical protein